MIAHGGDLFAVSREHGWNWREVLDFSASINPLGPPPGVRGAICGALDRIVHYPEREPRLLKTALARLWEVTEEQIIPGNGATELLHFFARYRPEEPVSIVVPAFSEFHRAYPGARLVPASHPAAWPEDGLLVVTQPLAPTGEAFPFNVLRDRILSTRQTVLVDESFLEFTGLPSAASLLRTHPALFILRSLTKFYALPGLRIGALIGPAAPVETLRACRAPWQVNVLAQAAALAALDDHEHAARSFQFITQERQWLFHQLDSLPGVSPHRGCANYLFVELRYRADELCSFLIERKILIRKCTGWPGVAGEAVRVAVRTRAENERLLDIWREFPCGS